MKYTARTILIAVCFAWLAGHNTILAQSSDTNPRFLIEVGGKKGFIDNSGKVIIPPTFDQATAFQNGVARVWINCYPCERRYINAQGAFIRTPIFDEGPHIEFSEGLAAVQIGDVVTGRYGFIDNRGSLVIQPRFRITFRFSEGLAWVGMEDGSEGYIDRVGSLVFRTTFEHAYEFREGLARVKQDRKVGFIDKTGKVAIPLRFDDAWDFVNGLAPVRIGKRWGFIDQKGEFLIPPKFADAFEFSEGLATVSLDGKKFGYVNPQGEIVIRPRFQKVTNFSEGKAVVRYNNKSWFIDKSGKIAIPNGFDEASNFSNGLAEVTLEGREVFNAIKAYINHKGEIVWTTKE